MKFQRRIPVTLERLDWNQSQYMTRHLHIQHLARLLLHPPHIGRDVAEILHKFFRSWIAASSNETPMV